MPTTDAGPRSTRTAQVLQALRFVLVGTAGTGLQVLLYLPARDHLPVPVATMTSWAVAAIITNLVHRWVTFSVHERRGMLVDNAFAFVTTLIGPVLATASTWAAHGRGTLVEVPVLVAATGVGGFIRFWLLRAWYRRRGAST